MCTLAGSHLGWPRLPCQRRPASRQGSRRPVGSWALCPDDGLRGLGYSGRLVHLLASGPASVQARCATWGFGPLDKGLYLCPSCPELSPCGWVVGSIRSIWS